MSIYIVFTILVAISIGGLLALFCVKAHEQWTNGKRTKCAVAIVGSMVALGLLVNLIVHLFPITFKGMLKQDILCIIIGTILTWMAAPFMKRGWRKILMLLTPILFFWFLIIFVCMPILGGMDLPMAKSEVEYTQQKDLTEVLDVDIMPEMGFSKAWDTANGYIVCHQLINDADSVQLSSVFEGLKAGHPLQIMESDHTGHMYMCVDDDLSRYINVIFNKCDVRIVYGGIWDKGVSDKFDSINSSLPEYKFLTFMSENFGPDWVSNERVAFLETIPLSWINQVKQTAKTNDNWSYKDDKESYDIAYNDDQFYIQMKLHKNLNGIRKIADIQFGTY